MNENLTPLVQLAKALENSPTYLISFFVTLLAAMVSDPIITALTVGAVTLGFLTNALIAVSAFAFAYVVMRMASNVANAIGISGQRIAESQTQMPQQMPQLFPPTTVMPPSASGDTCT